MISVFLPTYNHEKFIAEALNSVLAQDYPNLEVIVGDDASTDTTLAIAESYRRKHPNIFNILPPQQNLGVTQNCNRILASCRGKYIAFLSGDDIWLPRKLVTQIEQLQGDADAVVCFTGAEIFDSDSGKRIGVHAGVNQHTLLESDPLAITSQIGPLGTAMVKSSAIPKNRFDERLSMASDWLFFAEVACRGKILYVDDILTRYRRHQENLSRDSERLIIELLMSTYYLADRMPQFSTAAKNMRWARVYDHLLPHFAEFEKIESPLRDSACFELMQKVRISKLARKMSAEIWRRALIKAKEFLLR